MMFNWQGCWYRDSRSKESVGSLPVQDFTTDRRVALSWKLQVNSREMDTGRGSSSLTFVPHSSQVRRSLWLCFFSPLNSMV